MLPYTYVAVYSSPISIMATTMVAALTQMLLSIPPLATSMLIVCNAATFYYFNCLQLITLCAHKMWTARAKQKQRRNGQNSGQHKETTHSSVQDVVD